eukprot:TRINITY_DN7396_c0_g1_i5.p1 TRINITY_DN7396_c0_g1~~TRINITY_DN7396_c0_g1_i5.p1  ORF type:complete len:474 (-),score=41.54 TRINITY_DN7396_c0_g1_i5:42-1463(-)
MSTDCADVCVEDGAVSVRAVQCQSCDTIPSCGPLFCLGAGAAVTAVHHPADANKSRLIFFCVILNVAFNAFMSMSTSSSENVFIQSLGVPQNDIAVCYSIFLYTVLIGCTPGMWLCVKYETLSLGFAVIVGAISAWLRWFAIRSNDYRMVLASVIGVGVSTWPILALPAQIAANHFPRKRRVLITSALVQGINFGWLLSVIIPPVVAKDQHSLEFLSLCQAIVACVVVLTFALAQGIPRKEPSAPSEVSISSAEGSIIRVAESLANPGSGSDFIGFFRLCLSHPRLVAMMVASGLLGGVSFAYPSVAIFILRMNDRSDQDAVLVNSAFIVCGVAFGVFLGWICTDHRRLGIVLKSLFLLATASLSAIAGLAKFKLLGRFDILLDTVGVLVLSGLAGMSCLGFLGIAIQACAQYPVKDAYVNWAIEITIQLVGGVLNQVATADPEGFSTMAIVSAVSTVLMVFCFALPDHPVLQ